MDRPKMNLHQFHFHHRDMRRRLALSVVRVAALAIFLSAALDRVGDPVLADSSSRIFLPLLPQFCTVSAQCCPEQEREPNDRFTDAIQQPFLCEGTAIIGRFADTSDAFDVYRVKVTTPRTVQVELDLSEIDSKADYDVGISSCAEDHCRLGENRERESRLKRINLALDSGIYFIFVYRRNGISNAPYRLRWLSQRAPKLTWPDDEHIVSALRNPVELQWEPVIADRYEVKVHDYYDRHSYDDTFKVSEPRLALPQLPDGGYWWKVRALGTDAFADWSGEYMFYLCSTDLVHEIRVKSQRRYFGCRLDVGNEYYSDRGFRITSLSPALAGLTWIRTANEDSGAKEDSFLEFAVATPVEVVIGYDKRATSIPNWLASFEARPDLSVAVSDEEASPLRMFSRQFAAGKIQLGGNLASGASGAKSNYVVLVGSAK